MNSTFWYGALAAFFVFVGIPFICAHWQSWVRIFLCWKYNHLWYTQMMFKNKPEWGRRECLCCGLAQHFNPTTGEKHSQLFGTMSHLLWDLKSCIQAKGNIR